jgi:hypothetical protein
MDIPALIVRTPNGLSACGMANRFSEIRMRSTARVPLAAEGCFSFAVRVPR